MRMSCLVNLRLNNVGCLLSFFLAYVRISKAPGLGDTTEYFLMASLRPPQHTLSLLLSSRDTEPVWKVSGGHFHVDHEFR